MDDNFTYFPTFYFIVEIFIGCFHIILCFLIYNSSVGELISGLSGCAEDDSLGRRP